MREEQEKEGRKHGKIKGPGTVPGSRERFVLSAHGVEESRNGTPEFLPTVPCFSGRRRGSWHRHGTVRPSAVNGGDRHVG